MIPITSYSDGLRRAFQAIKDERKEELFEVYPQLLRPEFDHDEQGRPIRAYLVGKHHNSIDFTHLSLFKTAVGLSKFELMWEIMDLFKVPDLKHEYLHLLISYGEHISAHDFDQIIDRFNEQEIEYVRQMPDMDYYISEYNPLFWDNIDDARRRRDAKQSKTSMIDAIGGSANAQAKSPSKM